MPTDAELAELRRLLERCPPAPRARPSHLDTAGPEGLEVARVCFALVEDGIPMAAVSRALGRVLTWVHWLLNQHDPRPEQWQGRSTSRRSRP